MQPTLIHDFCKQPTLLDEDIPPAPANEEIKKTSEQQISNKNIGGEALFAVSFATLQDELPDLA